MIVEAHDLVILLDILMAKGRDADHTHPSSAKVKKELSYNSTHLMGPPGPVTGFPLPCNNGKNHFLNFVLIVSLVVVYM
jgi:hypothetical protein